MIFFVLKRILGVLFLLLGIAALVTPLTPGAFLIFVGLELLGLGFLIPSGLRKFWVRIKSRITRL
ncbi:MAG: PGPGW domain-containing protein [Candidatus Peribacteraceae bacterium]